MEWLFIGLAIGLGVWGLYAWTQKKNIRVAWYEWVLGALGIVSALFAYQNYAASMTEFEPQAAGFLLSTFGVTAIVFIAVAGFLVWRRQKTSTAVTKN